MKDYIEMDGHIDIHNESVCEISLGCYDSFKQKPMPVIIESFIIEMVTVKDFKVCSRIEYPANFRGIFFMPVEPDSFKYSNIAIQPSVGSNNTWVICDSKPQESTAKMGEDYTFIISEIKWKFKKQRGIYNGKSGIIRRGNK